jgi:GNAT superfamily N-acetyltransferase
VLHPDGVVAVAGFRVGENLAWGRFLYVDDLVTLTTHRSKGVGASLLSWLRDVASNEGCVQLHLDSGAQRKDAHRFYEREGMLVAGFHFVENIAPNKALHPTSPLTRRRG